MECNKEEAIRAKDLAERKMHGRDFVGAQKMILKAQQLFPDLENTLQMLTVCEVHCSAEAKVNGSEDWYGILQVEPTADDSLIKKQYKKLAFLLHPDKNKFAGAEAAFKLVGEAHRTLTDQAKRSVYDLKRRASIKTVGPKLPHHPRTSSTRKQPAVPNNYTNHAGAPFSNLNQTWATQQQTQATSASQTFWTACNFCGIRYQYYRSIINKALRCQSCSKAFIACDINAQGVPTGTSSGYPLNQSGINEHNGSEVQKNASQRSNGGNDTSHMDTKKNAGGAAQRVSGQGYRNKMEDSGSVENGNGIENEVKVEKVKLEKVNKGELSGNANKKRRRRVMVESSDADSSDSDIVFEMSRNVAASKTESTGGRYPRRSARQKQNVAYTEDKDSSDADDFENSSFKQSRRDDLSHNGDQSGKTSSRNDVEGPNDVATISKNKPPGTKRGIPTEGDIPNGNKQGKNDMKDSGDLKGKDAVDETSKDGDNLNPGSGAEKLNSDGVSYPDPEFHDFDMDKDLKSFATGQIWAMYDNLDGMPRFYARIRNVSSSGFKVHFTWLEYAPVDQAEIDWHEEKLPVGCGKFMLGGAENSDDIRMFSHLMSWTKGSKRNSYAIYPRKGEVWALFKGWDSKWRLHPDQHRQYEYEVVEVLSNFSVDAGANVVALVKVKGSVSLFCQAGQVLHIPHGELLRFSHMVPSYRMTGNEREGIPEGIFELDCVSLPTNLEEMFPSVALSEIRGNVEDAGCEDGVPVVPGTTERKSADEFEVHCPVRNNMETNVKIQVEKSLEVSDLSPGGLSRACKAENDQTSGSSFVVAGAEKIANEGMPSERLVNDKEKHLGGASTRSGINNAMENRNDGMPEPSIPMSIFCPDSEFCSFELERTKDQYETGQIWALYCEEDGFPKYYALVRKVDSRDFKVHITWLEACPQLQEEMKWENNNLPFGCGRFRPCSGADAKETYDTVETFSHLVRAVHVDKKQEYDIYPQVNEVWAVYRNWSAEWQLSDLQNCLEKGEYELVEVIDCSDSLIRVTILEKVDGFRAVFRPKRNSGTPATLVISQNQFLRFSHRIPSFRLTEQRGGKLRDCWELDPASVPDILFCIGTD